MLHMIDSHVAGSHIIDHQLSTVMDAIRQVVRRRVCLSGGQQSPCPGDVDHCPLGPLKGHPGTYMGSVLGVLQASLSILLPHTAVVQMMEIVFTNATYCNYTVCVAWRVILRSSM